MKTKENIARIKQSNKWAIHDFSLLNQTHRITGTKLEALYRLIQKKGQPIDSKDASIRVIMALEYDAGSFVAIIHKPVKKGSFFPCKTKTINLQVLK